MTKRTRRWREMVSALALVAAIAGWAQETKTGEAPDARPGVNADVKPDIPRDKARFHLFLLVGQSNMAGRGKIDPQGSDNDVHPRIWMMDKDGQWVPAKDPVHFDRPFAGVGPGMSFARFLAAKDTDVHIGLIPCAEGATGLGQWGPKSALFKRAVDRATRAQESGTLKGILWHQGESNTVEGSWNRDDYEKGLTNIVAAFRREFKSPDLPFLAGELGPWFKGKKGETVADFDALLKSLTEKIRNFGCVGAEGLKAQDGLHFDAASQRTFGQRYAEAYLTLGGNK